VSGEGGITHMVKMHGHLGPRWSPHTDTLVLGGHGSCTGPGATKAR